MQSNSVTLIGGRRFLPPHLFSSTSTTHVPSSDLPGFLHGWEVLTFFVIMLIVVPPVVIFCKRRYVHSERRGYEHVI